ncbi:C40 family peptidase [Anaerosolibacter sp.]|uniref:C40 family peptidase n=1 Tax=Anaerosolibacter sp. TaxID=1872527 RepID=UPI0039EF1E49
MALDPATVKLIGKAVISAATDEKTRRVILIACLVPFIALLLVLASPFAIFFSLTGTGTMEDSVSIVNTMSSLKKEFAQKIQNEQNDSTVDEIKMIIMGSEDNTMIDNASDVLIVFSTKYNVNDENVQQMVVLDAMQVENLKKVYWDMNTIHCEFESRSETVTYTTEDEDGNAITETKTVTKTIKIIYVNCLSAEEMAIAYEFNDAQQIVLQEMKKSGLGLLAAIDAKMFLSQEEIATFKSYIPVGVTVEGDRIVEIAESLEGKVHYFWGGKSTAIGWDSRWGTNMEVTSPGSPTTGTFRPFGLDCSGYISWVFINMGLPIETIGHGTTTQWNASTSIQLSEVKPGDLTFLAAPGTRKVNHIGIVVGRTDDGQIMVIHCSSGANNVTISTAESVGFLYYRRPAVLIN